ncbi:DNA-3-methyladenine glycosylase I [Ornithinibacillus halophilus]|uniref:DNA-3-methyladenine glycosylase I n=1 Tax=Ornithinibacillus halophilus TaxID=930117 RepID=A0A1M5H2B2_9BACI|nr:DNA-3-methyladenine glycosylase I [Ornithinibacillus halophilus]SHG10100.1 DNA-3-methyladenine glycosylase I [Ornithinibacillus halophilus]
MGLNRCSWANSEDELYKHYHDTEWGRPTHDDHKLFEMLILEGAQAGLSWITILRRRENYRRAFDDFDPKIISHYDDKKISSLLQNDGIIRNKRKVHSAINNAKCFLKVQEEYGTFDQYIWSFVDGAPILNDWQNHQDVPATTPESEKMSKELKKRGFSFVGPTICYAFMQATGMVNDHTKDCFLYHKNSARK